MKITIQSNRDSILCVLLLFRDDINAQDNCNADILIEQARVKTTTHTKENLLITTNEYLGLSGGRDNETKYGKEWNEKYQLDLIGRDYCRDRSIACSPKKSLIFYISWKASKKVNLLVAHEKWIQ